MSDTVTTVPREQTQAKLDQRSLVSSKFLASQPYTIADRFEERVAQFGARLFLQHGDEAFTYAEANQRINQVAHAALAQGVRSGDVVALAMENRPAFFFAWLGLTKAGATVAFINSHVSGKPLAHALRVTGATRVVVGEECARHFSPGDEALPPDLAYWLWPDAEKPAPPALLERFGLNLQAAAHAAASDNPPRATRARLTSGDCALHIFTSGTTGLPKAAVISHARWMMAGDVMQVTLQATEDDAFYTFLPLYHGAASMSAASTAISAGSRIVLRRKFSRSQFWRDVRRYQVTACQYVGEICRFLLNAPPCPDDRDHSLRKIVGTGMSPEVWQQWTERFGDQFRIFEGWGSTEANTNTLNVDNRAGSCGRVPYWEKTNLRLVRYDLENETHPRNQQGFMQLCGVDEPGEAIGRITTYPDIVAGRFEGYTSPEATEGKILRNVFEPGDAWWSSGDLLRCDADGYCWFVDRIGDTFRWKSENVSTSEVADVLSELPGLATITVYGVKIPQHDGRAGMVAIVLEPGARFDPQAFWQLATRRLPSYAVPLLVRIPSKADMTGNYKLRKVDLQREGFDTEQVQDPLYVRDNASQSYVAFSEAALQQALRG